MTRETIIAKGVIFNLPYNKYTRIDFNFEKCKDCS